MYDIINAILQTSIEIQDFDEPNLEMANNKAAKLFDGFPFSYLLIGKKKGTFHSKLEHL